MRASKSCLKPRKTWAGGVLLSSISIHPLQLCRGVGRGWDSTGKGWAWQNQAGGLETSSATKSQSRALLPPRTSAAAWAAASGSSRIPASCLWNTRIPKTAEGGAASSSRVTQSEQPPPKSANCNFLFHSPPMAEFLPWNCEDKLVNIWEVRTLRHGERRESS